MRPEWALARCKAFIAAPRREAAAGTSKAAPSCTIMIGRRIASASSQSSTDHDGPGRGRKLDQPAVLRIDRGAGLFAQATSSCTTSWEASACSKQWWTDAGGSCDAVRPQWHTYVHDPLRLSVCIEAPVEAMTRSSRVMPRCAVSSTTPGCISLPWMSKANTPSIPREPRGSRLRAGSELGKIAALEHFPTKWKPFVEENATKN